MKPWMEEWEKAFPKHATRTHKLFAYIRELEAERRKAVGRKGLQKRRRRGNESGN